MGKRKQVRVGPPPTTAEEFGEALFAAVPGDADWLAPDFTLPPALAAAADLIAGQLIGRACRGGWLPEDLRQVARRRLDEFAGSYLLDALAAYAGQFPAVHPDWLAQLDAVRWWNETEPHLPQWAAKHILTPSEAVAAVIDAVGLLKTLPPVTVVLPAPGTPLPRPARHPVDDKKLSRVRALLAKAESSSFPEEAEALSAKAQELMTRHALDRALVEAGTGAPDRPAARRIWLDTPYTDAKSLLVHVVAKANRCRAIFDARWDFVTVVGDELDSVELLTTSLLVQANRAMIADPAGRSRDFRKSFLVSYATRIGERLEQAAKATIAEAPGLVPVLASREAQVAAAFTELFPEVVSKSVTVRSHEGWGAGREAADRAQLGE
ncbi:MULTISPECIES: DUF2786 domain-containing protein [unclassified Amycolatopsis]|uniref:DUF2786 domain-containing protein n=1 Tax=unclassified Amycolatopsis TaxID=2618356 RepID=UPI0028746054|nr:MULTISPECIES: DUF2786 domain-containing protein [unclassified Amycolatopsis]MDS0137995.1 DUF2786 domain-containing protein [Amycolatopsis sp. 505]MDS0144092.1 DUF2786 domain-containing protein [Amycolatopsis sp. CM201R]